MIDIKTLNRNEQIALLMQLEAALGWYPIVTIDVDDVRERFENEGETPPPDAVLHQACHYVSRKNCEESTHLIDWAQEVASELMEKTA